MSTPLDYEPPREPKPGMKISTMIRIAIFLTPFVGVAMIVILRFFGLLK